MNFFEYQDRARKKTGWLLAYFVLAIVLMIIAIYAVVVAIFLRNSSEWFRPDLFGWVTLTTLLIVVGGSLMKIIALRDGGASVATMLGGTLVNSNSTDPAERKVLNVVEEMAIASGTPVPDVYLLRDEPGINAFAAGFKPGDAVVGVTRGVAKHLTRDELQGVVAHEFSHILNGDMRLNIRLIGLVHGIFCLAQLGRVLMRTSSRTRLGARSSKKDSNPLPLLGLALMVIGSIGVFFGRLIKSAVSRQREFLADAAAVQFTRNPDGLAGALKRIGAATWGSKLDTAHAEEASHMFFSNALAASWANMMATHPPLTERIGRLDPSFDGNFEPFRPTPDPQVELPPRIAPRPQVAAMTPVAALTPMIGAPKPVHVHYAANLRESLPPTISKAVHEPLGAVAVVYGLLCSSRAEVRLNQVSALHARPEKEVMAEFDKVVSDMAKLDIAHRLPVLQMALPALTRLSPKQFESLRANTQMLIEADAQVDLFEFTLNKIIGRHVEQHFAPSRAPVVQFYSIRPLVPACAVLLSLVARSGHSDSAQVERAFATGAARFGSGNPMALLPLDACGLGAVDEALEQLAQASPAIKRAVIEGCAMAAATDGVLQTYEAELLRAIGDSLDVPIPPFVQGV